MKHARHGSLIESGAAPGKVIWMLAWPVILDQTFQTMVQYIDSAMVGSLGAVATAAIAANASTIWLLNGSMYAIAVAFGVLAARYIGAHEPIQVRHVVRQACMSAIGLSVVATLLILAIAPHLPLWIGVASDVAPHATIYMQWVGYAFPATIAFMFLANMIRSSGDTLSPLIANIMASVVNVAGNFLLIFPSRTIGIFGGTLRIPGAGLGVKGAAIATAISACVSAGLLLIVFIAKDSPIQLHGRQTWNVQPKILKLAVKIGLPLALERIVISSGQIVLTMLVSSIGTVALASHHLANTAETITFMPASGFSIAATTLVAQSLGARNKTLAKKFASRTLASGTVLMTCTGILMYIFSNQLLMFFTKDHAVIELGSRVLRIEAFAEPFFAMSIVVSGILRGAGDTRRPFVYSLIGMWLVRLVPASLLILVWDKGLEAAWLCMMADLMVRGVLHLLRYLKGTWVNHWEGT